MSATPSPPSPRRRSRAEEIRALRAIAAAGGDRAPIELSSRELGVRIEASQQAADRHLLSLERAGEILRTRSGRRSTVAVTPAGLDVLRKEYAVYRRLFEGPSSLHLAGTVVSGLGEGRYYLSQPGYAEQFPSRLGYRPYPGTLNVRLEGERLRLAQAVRHWAGIRIEGFQANGRTFGGATCIRAEVGGTPGHLIRPDRTHHSDVLEFVAPVCLREALGLRDGSTVDLRLEES
ncbi:MAG: DUF120 domain-containing protein [Thermoplasmata archaeon]